MSRFETRVLVNYIKRLSPEGRKAGLADLLVAFPDDWLDEAITIAQAVREYRAKPQPMPSAPPRFVDPRLRRQVP